MKVISITHSYGPHGAGITLLKAIRHWTATLGWQVDALCDDRMAEKYGRELAACGARPVGSLLPANYDLALINTVLNTKVIDSLVTNAPSLPICLWVREGTTMLANCQEPIAAWVRRFARCKAIIYQTAWQRDEVFRSFTVFTHPDRIAVIPGGIELMEGPLQAPATRSVFRIVGVGSVNGRKRFGDIAKVVRKLSGEFPLECEFVGELTNANSMDPESLELVTAPPPYLKWLGALSHEETLKRVAGADLFCLPSGDETFASAPLEAASRGVPVLISALPPYKYVGWRDGENCALHGVGNLSQIESQLRRILTEPEFRQRIRAAGKELADQYRMDVFLSRLTDRVLLAAGKREPARQPST